jgi:translation initiation factor 1
MEIDLINNVTNSIKEQLDNEAINVHIRIQKRNGKKCWTFIENMEKINSDQKFLKKLTQSLGKSFQCSAFLKSNMIHLTGDHRDKVKEYLVKNLDVSEKNIKIHGF